MKTVMRYKFGDPIPDNGVFIRDETVSEPLSTDELYDMSWPGLGPWPHITVRYVWYEIPVEASAEVGGE